MKPRQPPTNWNDKLREVQATLNGHEAMFGDLREAKGVRRLGVQIIAPKRTRAPSTLPSEHQEQVAVIHFWRHACHTYKLPDFALFAAPNAGLRDPRQGAWLKAEGMRAGIPDLLLDVRTPTYAGLRIELKRMDGYASPEQKTVGAYLLEAGYCWKVCRGADSAIETIREYLK